MKLIQGDITQCQVDAIVNAANPQLAGGGGVDGAIHRAAGSELLEACKSFNGCSTGDAVITPGFNLLARFVIHTVGPVWQGGNAGESELLASCYRRSLEVAVQYGLNSVVFSAISCGVYGYPLDQAARIAVDTVRHCEETFASDMQISIICFGPDVLAAFVNALQQPSQRQ